MSYVALAAWAFAAGALIPVMGSLNAGLFGASGSEGWPLGPRMNFYWFGGEPSRGVSEKLETILTWGALGRICAVRLALSLLDC